jgi:hypothetical protein
MLSSPSWSRKNGIEPTIPLSVELKYQEMCHGVSNMAKCFRYKDLLNVDRKNAIAAGRVAARREDF